jgi:hypothetical protein
MIIVPAVGETSVLSSKRPSCGEVPKSESKSKFCYDWRSVGQSVLMSSTHLGLATRFLLLSESCGFVDVGRGLFCRLQLLLVLARAVILGPASRGTRDHILLSQIRESPNLEGEVPVFISFRNRVAQLYPQTLGSVFVASYDSQGYGGGIRTHFHTGLPIILSLLVKFQIFRSQINTVT